MKRPLTFLFVVIMLAAAVTSEPHPSLTGDYLRLQGRWVVLKNELRTIDIPEMHGRSFIFEGKTFRLDTDQGHERYILDENTEPKTIDFDDEHSSVVRGIYRLESEKLIICTGAPEAERPKDFKTSLGSGTILTELKREK